MDYITRNKCKLMIVGVIVFLALVAVAVLPAQAGDGLPKGVEVFEVDDHTCVLYSANGGDKAVMECFCPCDGCEEPTELVISPTPVPTGTPVPQPTDRPKCNAGRGNGSEGEPDCDPGNSGGHNQGGD